MDTGATRTHGQPLNQTMQIGRNISVLWGMACECGSDDGLNLLQLFSFGSRKIAIGNRPVEHYWTRPKHHQPDWRKRRVVKSWRNPGAVARRSGLLQRQAGLARERADESPASLEARTSG